MVDNTRDSKDRFHLFPDKINFTRVNVTYNVSRDNLGLTYGCPVASDRFSTENLYRLTVEVGIVGALCLFGFVGSFLTIVILRLDKDKNNTTTWLLQVLAVVDILYLTASIFIQPVKTIYTVFFLHPDHHLLHAYLYLESYSWFVASIIQTITIWVVILVTTDRYLAICKPLSCRKLRTIRNCQIAVVAVVILAVIYNIPQVYEREIRSSKDDCTKKKQTSKIISTDLRYSTLYFLLYKTVCYVAFRSLGPLLALVVLNSRLMAALREIRRRRRSLTRLCTHGENLTLMLVVVVSVFVVCELPDCCIRLAMTLYEYVESMTLDSVAVRYANVVANMLHAFNSSVNFLIYCLVGKKFRRILARLCDRNLADRSIQEDEVEPRLTTTNQPVTNLQEENQNSPKEEE